MFNLDDFISALPEKQQDAFRLSIIEGEERAREISDIAVSRGLNLAVEVDGEIFINVNAVKQTTGTAAAIALLGSVKPEDYSTLCVGMGDLCRSAEVFVGRQVDTLD